MQVLRDFVWGPHGEGPKEKDIGLVEEMISEVKSLGLETCATLRYAKRWSSREIKGCGFRLL